MLYERRFFLHFVNDKLPARQDLSISRKHWLLVTHPTRATDTPAVISLNRRRDFLSTFPWIVTSLLSYVGYITDFPFCFIALLPLENFPIHISSTSFIESLQFPRNDEKPRNSNTIRHCSVLESLIERELPIKLDQTFGNSVSDGKHTENNLALFSYLIILLRYQSGCFISTRVEFFLFSESIISVQLFLIGKMRYSSHFLSARVGVYSRKMRSVKRFLSYLLFV